MKLIILKAGFLFLGIVNMARYFKTASDKRYDKAVKCPAIKKQIANWRRAFMRSIDKFDSNNLKGCVAYFTYEQLQRMNNENH